MPISKDPEKRAKQLKALDEHRKENPRLAHGMKRFIKTSIHKCDICVKAEKCDRYEEGARCSYLAEYKESLVNEVMAMDHINKQDKQLVMMLAKELGVVWVCDLYLEEHGMIIHDEKTGILDIHPLVSVQQSFLNAAEKTMAELGMGPLARARRMLD